MIIIGANWVEVLSWNIRQAGALWYAWGGGVSTIVTGVVRLAAPIDTDTSLVPGLEIGVSEDDGDRIEADRPERHLKLVD